MPTAIEERTLVSLGLPRHAREIAELVRGGAPPSEMVRLLRGAPPKNDEGLVPFKMLTGPLEAIYRELGRGTGGAGGSEPPSGGAPILRGVTSSNSKDLHRSRMRPTALASMQRSILDDLTFFLNHEYKVPEDVLGRGIEAEMVKRRDEGSNTTYTDLDVGVLVVPEDTNPRAMQTFRQVRSKVKHGFSIGAFILDYSWEEEDTYQPVALSEDEEFCSGIFGPPPGVIMAVDDVLLVESSCVGIPSNRRSWTRSLSWDAQIFGEGGLRTLARFAGRAVPKRPPWETTRTYSVGLSARQAAEAGMDISSINSTQMTIIDEQDEPDGLDHGEGEREEARGERQATRAAEAAAQQARGDHGPVGEHSARAGTSAGQGAARSDERPGAARSERQDGARRRRGGGSAPAAQSEGAALPALPEDQGDHRSLTSLETGSAGAGGGATFDDGTAGSEHLTSPFRDLEAEALAIFDYEGGAVQERAATVPLQARWRDEDETEEEDEEEYEAEDPRSVSAPLRSPPPAPPHSQRRVYATFEVPSEADEDPTEEDADFEDPSAWGPFEDDPDEETEGRSTDAEKSAQQRRSTRYGIGVKKGGNVTKPSSWSQVPDNQWGDPVNYRYPMPDKNHADNAASRWGDSSNRSQYSSKEQGIIGKRIKARQRHFGSGDEPDKEESAASGTTRAAQAQHPMTGRHTHQHSHDGAMHSHRHAHDGDGRHAGHPHTQAQEDALEDQQDQGADAFSTAPADEDTEKSSAAPPQRAAPRPEPGRQVAADYGRLLSWAERQVANCRGEPLSAHQIDDLLGLHALLTDFLSDRGLLIEDDGEDEDEGEQEGDPVRATVRDFDHRGRRLAIVIPAGRAGEDEDALPKEETEYRGATARLRDVWREIAAAEDIREELLDRLSSYTRQATRLRADLRRFEAAVREAESVGLGRPTRMTVSLVGGVDDSGLSVARGHALPREDLLALPPGEALARMRAEMDG